MEIKEKYIRLIGKCIYNKELDKFGYIKSLKIESAFGLGISFEAYYDAFDSNHIVFFEDFEKGKIQFILISSPIIPESILEKQVEDIRFALEDKFSESMYRYVDDKEWKDQIIENAKRNFQHLHTDLVRLTEISVEVLVDDLYCRELYLKMKKGTLSKKQMLYAMINHLAQEHKRVKDSNFQYFVKYELFKDIEKPPLGIMPTYIWKEKRLNELHRAISEYQQRGFEPQKEWIEEAEKLEQELEAKSFYGRTNQTDHEALPDPGV